MELFCDTYCSGPLLGIATVVRWHCSLLGMLMMHNEAWHCSVTGIPNKACHCCITGHCSVSGILNNAWHVCVTGLYAALPNEDQVVEPSNTNADQVLSVEEEK